MTPAVLRLTRALVAHEVRDQTRDQQSVAAFEVCRKFRLILVPLVGEHGIQVLFSRALKLATKEAPWLSGVRILEDGSIEYPRPQDGFDDAKLAAEGGEILLCHIIWLLLMLIGKGLTLRLLRDVWPDAPDAPDLDMEENS